MERANVVIGTGTAFIYGRRTVLSERKGPTTHLYSVDATLRVTNKPARIDFGLGFERPSTLGARGPAQAWRIINFAFIALYDLICNGVRGGPGVRSLLRSQSENLNAFEVNYTSPIASHRRQGTRGGECTSSSSRPPDVSLRNMRSPHVLHLQMETENENHH